MNNKKAFITISFGSTFSETRIKDIGGIENALKEAFPNYDHFNSFTSSIIRRILKKQNIIIDDPQTLLEKLLSNGYTDIVIQPTHLLHGEEFEHKILTLKTIFTEKFKSFIVSRPLITTESDYISVATAITTQFPSLSANECVILMGHGSPRKNNQSFGNTYTKLQNIFQQLQLPVFVGTVEEEDTPNLSSVLAKLQNSHYKKAHLFPLMVVAGDHANNDMYSNEEDSWKSHIEALGIKTEGYLYGLGRNKAIQAIYICHSLEALSK